MVRQHGADSCSLPSASPVALALTALRKTHIMPTPSMLCSHRTSTTPMAQASRYQNRRRAVRLQAGRPG